MQDSQAFRRVRLPRSSLHTLTSTRSFGVKRSETKNRTANSTFSNTMGVYLNDSWNKRHDHVCSLFVEENGTALGESVEQLPPVRQQSGTLLPRPSLNAHPRHSSVLRLHDEILMQSGMLSQQFLRAIPLARCKNGEPGGARTRDHRIKSPVEGCLSTANTCILRTTNRWD